jgi:hypothetical protein
MSAPPTAPAEAYAPDADRAGPDALAHSPDWLVRCLALLIFFVLEHLLALRPHRSVGLPSSWQDRPDLPPGSAQAMAASRRGAFGNAIVWMCRSRGIGPGHPDWPELSRAIVAFGGSVKGFRAGLPACGLLWWENPNIAPGMTGETAATPAAAAIASLLARQAAADAPPLVPHAVRAAAGHARFPASWLSESCRQVFARAGTGPPTGPPLPGPAARDCQLFHA